MWMCVQRTGGGGHYSPTPGNETGKERGMFFVFFFVLCILMKFKSLRHLAVDV